MTTRPLPSPAALRRTALTAAAVCLVFAAPLCAAEPEYKSRAGADAAGFQKFLDEAHDQGYEPIYVNGYNVGDHAEYAGVAIQDPDHKPFEARFDLSDDEYRDFFKKMSDKGFRPTCVSGYRTKAGPRFAAVWVKDDRKAMWRAKHNQTHKEFKDTLTAMHDEGFTPACVTAYQAPDGSARYTSLFIHRMNVSNYDYRHNMTADQLKDQVDKWRSDGFRVLRVHAYESSNGLRFLANAWKGERNPPLWQEHHGLSGEEYQDLFDKLSDKGFRPMCICGYLEDGEVRFAAIWQKKQD